MATLSLHSIPSAITLYIFILIASINADNLIEETCKQVPDLKDLCVQTLTSDPKSKTSNDAHGLTSVAIGLTAKEAAVAGDQITRLAEQVKAHEEELLQCLADCEEEYEDAVQQLEQCRVSMDEKEYHEVVMFVEAALNDVKNCEEACKNVEEKEKKELIEEKNNKVRDMCNFALALTIGLQQHKNHVTST
ncbi:putative invertase inhibitor [Dioscorea cayenensis subsp. rotundata]|uniref:Invertase inhibitor n=1 Tax=Dioscorea cayennensis subsp. rotundata TaxID=55577 RepID=A0AB40CA03_DIOCR|nr:putative invertase inhibitor [Dioscorea cayenensis subsp. rotundata]